MKEVKILGVTIGECKTINILYDDPEAIFENFEPNENLYKLLPAFPKEIAIPSINRLYVNFFSGRILLINAWDYSEKIVFDEKLILDNFKGEK